MSSTKYWNSISLLILAALLASGCSTKGQLAKAGIVLVEGSDLFYKVNAGGQEYPFDLNINEFGDEIISFDWDMGGARSGTVAMFDQALVDAREMFNYFSGGYTELKDKTSVWISKGLFKDLKSGKMVEIGLGNGVKETFQYKGKETWSFGKQDNGTPYQIPVFIIATKDNSKEIWIADDPQNRLIVMMNIDFRIDLVGFKAY